MNRHPLNPFNKVDQHINELEIRDRFLFSPLYGLGDRAAFYAYLQAFKEVHRVNLSIVCLSGEKDPVALLFPGLAESVIVVPQGVAVAPLELTHWVYGASVPTAGKLFFTWHWAFGDGSVAADYERAALSNGVFTHKRLIKDILRLSPTVKASSIDIAPSEMGGRSKADRVMLCPKSNTIPAPTEQWWLTLARALRAEGFTPIFNVASAASMLTNGAPLDAVGFDTFDGPVSQFLSETAGYAGVVTARSGMCELLALSGRVPYLIVSQQPVSPFWALGDEFGRPPELSLTASDRTESESVRLVVQTLKSSASL